MRRSATLLLFAVLLAPDCRNREPVAPTIINAVPATNEPHPQPIGSVLLVGQVLNADSTPAINAVTWYQVYADTACVIPYYNGLTEPVDSGATYHHLIFLQVGERRCLAVYAAPPAARSDSMRSALVHTVLSHPDTVSMPPVRLR